MENGIESASSSAIAWRWTIEALASFKEVKPSLLHDVIDQALELPEDTRNNAGEMVALKCLEGLFAPLNCIGKNGPPAQGSKVAFDSSESCADVVKRIYKETPKSALRVAGPDMLKWDVGPFIDQKRASMRCALHQLNDTILDGTHPYADFLMQKSGLTPIDNRDSAFPNNEDGIELSKGLDSSSSDPQDKKEKGKGSPVLLEDERRKSVVNASSSSLLPSKRNAADSTSEDEARQLSDSDDGYINVKKLKQHSAHSFYSGQGVASSHGTEVGEDLSERVVPQNEIDDTDHLDEHDQMTFVEDNVVEEEHFGVEKSGQCTASEELHQGELGTPYTMPDCTQDSEMHEVISVEKAKDASELPNEPKTSYNSSAVGNQHDVITDDPERGFADDNHVNEINTTPQSGFLPKTVATNIDVGLNPDGEEEDILSDTDSDDIHHNERIEEEEDILSDSDGYHNERIAEKKKEFFSSQCMVDPDSFPLADRKEAVCVKCKEGGQLLSCNISDCPLVVHDKCLGSLARMNDEGYFCCPFCSYSLTISEYLEAKKHAALAKKNVATFFRTALRHQSIVIKEVLQRKDLDPSRNAGVEDVAKICEDVDLENKDNQVTLDREHVKEVVDHQTSTITDIERIIELSGPLHIVNSNNREKEASPFRVAPDVLTGEKDGDELVNQKCQGNTVAELVDQECQGNAVEELVDQECQGNAVEKLVDQECRGNTVVELVDQEFQGNTGAELADQKCGGNVAELKDGQKAIQQHDISGILHGDQGPVEVAAMHEDLQYQTDDNEEEPANAINIEGEKSSDDDNDESIISRYSIRFRRKYLHTCSKTHQFRRKNLPWTAEEEETLREGVRKFSTSAERSPNIPWKKILEFGSNVYLQDRTSRDLKDKWRNLCRSSKMK